MAQSSGTAAPAIQSPISGPLASLMSTAAMPMPGGSLQREMLDILDGHTSLYEFCLLLPQLAEALRKNPTLQLHNFSINRTADAIDQDEGTG
ncbi:hypothetical protein NW755_003609 [Fusarium falciforme]|uniref:Uncharacterized protein n=1 Tax=Fusarium falciforme TaxID=195108 RepID=A0A9W8REB3_9HYPO|nr:hypothetical protein NW755_003609 [Fusarium falciforme]